MGLQTLFKWIEGTEDCRLPCWAGITPGETNWNEAKQVVETMTSFSNVRVLEDQDCVDRKCNLVSWTLISDWNTRGNWVSGLDEGGNTSLRIQIVEAALVKALNLFKILNQYGKPAFLLFSTEPDLPGDVFLELILVYPERHFVIKYSKYATLSENYVVSCGKDSHIELIVLDNQEQLISLVSIANSIETKDLHVDV